MGVEGPSSRPARDEGKSSDHINPSHQRVYSNPAFQQVWDTA
jgi:hypothetical protein